MKSTSRARQLECPMFPNGAPRYRTDIIMHQRPIDLVLEHSLCNIRVSRQYWRPLLRSSPPGYQPRIPR